MLSEKGSPVTRGVEWRGGGACKPRPLWSLTATGPSAELALAMSENECQALRFPQHWRHLYRVVFRSRPVFVPCDAQECWDAVIKACSVDVLKCSEQGHDRGKKQATPALCSLFPPHGTRLNLPCGTAYWAACLAAASAAFFAAFAAFLAACSIRPHTLLSKHSPIHKERTACRKSGTAWLHDAKARTATIFRVVERLGVGGLE